MDYDVKDLNLEDKGRLRVEWPCGKCLMIRFACMTP